MKLPRIGTLNGASAALMIGAAAIVPAGDAGGLKTLPSGPWLKAGARRATVRIPTVVSVSPQFEIAPTGTYAEMKRALALYQTAASTSPLATAPPAEVAWLSDVSARIDELAVEAQEEGILAPSERTLSFAQDAISICAAAGVTEPAVEHDDEGGIEIYLKEGLSALLVAIQANDVLTVFGDDTQEQWRSRYLLSGSTWKRHLARLAGELPLT